jgi:hypothetical protein
MATQRFSLFVALALSALLSGIALAESPRGAIPLKNSPALSVIEVGGWKKIQNGLELRRMTLERSQPRQVVTLQLARFDTQWTTPHIIHSSRYNLNGTDVKTLAEKSGALAAINGNYFDEKGRALGYLKSLAQKLNSQISKSSLFTGIFGVKDRQPFIVHRDRFDPQNADEGLQAGPLLLSGGQALRVTRGAEKQSRRALIATDRNQRWIIAVADSVLGGVNWVELQELFAFEQWQINAVELLNLDGGGSAQLYVKSAQVEEFIPGSSDVPVAVGFYPPRRVDPQRSESSAA